MFAGIFGIAVGCGVGIFALPVALPLIATMIPYTAAAAGTVLVGTRIAGGVVGSGIGKGISYAICAFIKSDYWKERTQR